MTTEDEFGTIAAELTQCPGCGLERLQLTGDTFHCDDCGYEHTLTTPIPIIRPR
jgi:tRNA(Ile2) C34 agmatinyltransferase TiaS